MNNKPTPEEMETLIEKLNGPRHQPANRYRAKERSRMRKRNRTSLILLAIDALLLLATVILFSQREIKFSWEAFLPTGIVLAIAGLFIYNLVTDAISSFFYRHKQAILIVSTLAVFGWLFYFCLNPEDFQDKYLLGKYIRLFDGLTAEGLFGSYTAQLSLTFISISVMSVLSDKSVVIYWSNVSKDRLIEPVFSCFAAYTYYSIAATVGSGIGVITSSPLLFYTCFGINIFVLILLTLSVTDVYYSRDTKKRKLVKKLRSCVSWADDKSRISKKYEDMMLSLEQNINAAAASCDLLFLQEVYTLIANEPACFTRDIGRQAVDTLVDTLDDSNFSVFAEAMETSLQTQEKLLNELNENLEKGLGRRAFNHLASDSPLWESASQNGYFLNLLSAKPYIDSDALKQRKYFGWIAKRMEIEYQRCLALYLYNTLQDPESIENFDNYDWKTYEKVMDFAFDKAGYFDNALMVSLCRILCATLDKDHGCNDIFDNSFYVYYMLDQIEFLDIQDNLRLKCAELFRHRHPDPKLRHQSKWATKK